ncbi:MAG: class I SAM-dependent methyltransferase [Candidatus Binataceae bacterium]
MAGYEQDLAYIHHAGFADFSAKAAPWLLAMMRRCGIRNGLVVDLGCGSGVWARRLSETGYNVLGIDGSASMIALARRNAPRASLCRNSFLDAELPRCDAVTALGEVFNYTFDASNTQRELFRLFGRIHAALRPGGALIFDMAAPGRMLGGVRCNYTTGKDWAVLVENREEGKLLTRRITTFRKVGRFYRRGEEVHRQRLYRDTDIAKALRRVGFNVRALRGYGAIRFRPGLTGFVARKPRG